MGAGGEGEVRGGEGRGGGRGVGGGGRDGGGEGIKVGGRGGAEDFGNINIDSEGGIGGKTRMIIIRRGRGRGRRSRPIRGLIALFFPSNRPHFPHSWPPKIDIPPPMSQPRRLFRLPIVSILPFHGRN